MSEAVVCTRCEEVFPNIMALSAHIKSIHLGFFLHPTNNSALSDAEIMEVLNSGSSDEEDDHSRNGNPNIKTDFVAKNQLIETIPAGHVDVQHSVKTRRKGSKSSGHKHDGENYSETFTFYGCNRCTKLFISKVNLKNHLGTHNGGVPTIDYCSEKIFPMKSSDLSCPVCHRRFRNKFDQMVHLASHAQENSLSGHKNPQIVKLEADKNSPPKEIQKEKMDLSGSKRKNFHCTYCEKAFWKSYQLREHMGIHTGEKSKQCKYCDKDFRFSSGLYRHIRHCQSKVN